MLATNLYNVMLCFLVSGVKVNSGDPKAKNQDKPLLRRKSDLPTDILTQKALETHQVKGKFCVFGCKNGKLSELSLAII